MIIIHFENRDNTELGTRRYTELLEVREIWPNIMMKAVTQLRDVNQLWMRLHRSQGPHASVAMYCAQFFSQTILNEVL